MVHSYIDHNSTNRQVEGLNHQLDFYGTGISVIFRFISFFHMPPEQHDLLFQCVTMALVYEVYSAVSQIGLLLAYTVSHWLIHLKGSKGSLKMYVTLYFYTISCIIIIQHNIIDCICVGHGILYYSKQGIQ
jgi:hypothetical protein